MNTKQWDKDIEKTAEKGIHKTALDLINGYWNTRREREEREKEE